MTILLPTLAVAFAAFCIWLTVRIVNRKERWAKWTLAGLIGVPVLYVASFGPACWLNQRTVRPSGNGHTDGFGYRFILLAYHPLLNWAGKRPAGSDFVYWYARLMTAEDTPLTIMFSGEPNAEQSWKLESFHWEFDD